MKWMRAQALFNRLNYLVQVKILMKFQKIVQCLGLRSKIILFVR